MKNLVGITIFLNDRMILRMINFIKNKKSLFEEWFSTLPGTGLEPAHRKALGSKPSVSTNSTIPAPY